MKIIYDAMGGDNAPGEILKGAIEAKKIYDTEPVFVGIKDIIKKHLEKLGEDPDTYEILHADSVIENNEEPVKAIRTKKDSSMVIGLQALSEGGYDGFISCGSTGALLAGGLFIIKRFEGIKRPPISAILPTKTNPVLLVDAGANLDLSADILLQFAILANTYIKQVMGVDNPRLGLLNIGSEEGKGNNLSKETYELLSDYGEINFVGNIEANQVPFGGVDVLITDGFAGNVFLKTYEGTADMIVSLIKDMVKDTKDIIFLLKLRNKFKKIKFLFDYSDFGGAPLLGLKEPVFKAHGSSEADSIVGATGQMVKFIESNAIDIMKENIAKQLD